jgi:hypothetical protein
MSSWTRNSLGRASLSDMSNLPDLGAGRRSSSSVKRLAVLRTVDLGSVAMRLRSAVDGLDQIEPVTTAYDAEGGRPAIAEADWDQAEDSTSSARNGRSSASPLPVLATTGRRWTRTAAPWACSTSWSPTESGARSYGRRSWSTCVPRPRRTRTTRTSGPGGRCRLAGAACAWCEHRHERRGWRSECLRRGEA